MAQEFFPESGLPIRRTVELLPSIFQTESNSKFLSAVLDPLVQPGTLQKTVGYIGRRYGKTYVPTDIYLDTDNTLRSRYQLEPGVTVKENNRVTSFYDYLDFKNQIKFFGNLEEYDAIVTSQDHYTWTPPIDWDKFVNYREYYWVPAGPPPVTIAGQAQRIVSTYRVALGTGSVFIFTPDGMSNNPTITLYRGQTYKFQVSVPGHGFTIKTNVDIGRLTFDPNRNYTPGELVVFDEKLWKAKTNISSTDGSTIDENSQDWEYVEDVGIASQFDYNTGVTNNGAERGTVTFEVPMNAPDVLFYQSTTDINRVGRFIIADVDTNTKIDVEKEILGKVTYTSSNDVTLTNGMIIYFSGKVSPEKYSNLDDKWLVEGVGKKITLTKFTDLIVSASLSGNNIDEILFDNGGFDTQPFDDATAYPAKKDYLTINRSSVDSNPWSRYNRWFHRSVLDYSHTFNGSSFEATEDSRAKRPIVEFKANLQLFNHGALAKQTVDYIDDFTSDVFSTVEGSSGYLVDGEALFEGARVLVTADTDSLANNQIYVVHFITHNGSKQINLKKAADGDSIINECVLIRRGVKNSGLMYHYNGTTWIKSQEKTSSNQEPLFDLFDDNGVSFSDIDTYPVSTFAGTRILGYQQGSGVVDTELGFSLSYLNIENVGDIKFSYDLDYQDFNYKVLDTRYTKKYKTGFYKFNPDNQYGNGWILLDNEYSQPIIDTTVVDEITDTIVSTAVDWSNVQESQIRKIVFYKNGIRSRVSWQRQDNRFIFEEKFQVNDTVTIKIFADLDPATGYYELPLGLEKNPLNDEIESFTLGQASDHVLTGLDLTDNFEGLFPGKNNLRDLDDFQNRCNRFLKHSNVSPLSVLSLCDKEVNIIKSIQYAKKAYTDFKNTFIDLAYNLYSDQEPRDFVDQILEEISKSQNSSRPFSESDMVGSGAFTSIDYTVEDTGIKTFALSSKFDLDTLSSRAVYVYRNGVQLLHGTQYEFNSTFGFINLTIELAEGDEIQIREYVSSYSNYIPPTPTKLGLYKKYTPMKYLDDTFISPREVIQGHDGSLTASYGDFRDDLLLELEYRIYNNIKQKYDENIFDNDLVLGGYYGNSLYDKPSVDSIVSLEFLKWIADTNIDYINNLYFDSEESFTYTYSNMTDPTGTKNLPGYWRGVYKWFYDTDRPHLCPWEMLGFSEKPTWWESEYGPAPYTKNNLILWEDLRDGIIRHGNRAGTYKRYQRPSLIGHIPVDGDGNLVSPLNSGLATNFTLFNNQGSFDLGSVAPVEAAWRSSSEWPFAYIIALCLLKPFEYITDNYNKSEIGLNVLGQTINKNTGTFSTISDIIFENSSTKIVSGLVNYVADYLKSKTTPIDVLKDKITHIDVNLSTRLSGFVDQSQQKYLLDSKNPNSSTSNIFIPQENYDIIFNVSSPIFSLVYSGVILEKTTQGWRLQGYDNKNPFFYYYEALTSQSDPIISVGGVSESFLNWSEEKFYGNGVVVKYNNNYYRSLSSHTSTTVFDKTLWKQLPDLPLKNAVQAFRRNKFNRLSLRKMPYGRIMSRIQEVVDFLLGYQEYLISIGFVFDGYDAATQSTADWFTSVKEFMFWTKHNWSNGSLLTLSPSAAKITAEVSIGVADNFLDSFYDYQILREDGTPLQPNFINVARDHKQLVLSTVDTNAGIYFMRANFVLKEHVTVFDDRTVFNDVIYDKPTGYRQMRIKSRGFRTVDWDGDYTSPGFIFDNVKIETWRPFTDYRLGDIVAYKSYYWVSKQNQLGSENIDETKWSKLDSVPTKGLVSNFDYRISQFGDYYEVEADGVGSSQRDLARHAIGYQSREYLQALAEDEVSQFRIYQGFIREKGTANSIVKVFDKLSRSKDDSIVLNEEWAFKIGEFGGTDQTKEVEFLITKDSLVINPQPVLVVSSKSNVIVDQNLRIDPSMFTIRSKTFTTDINPVEFYKGTSRSAGYVHKSDVDYVAANRDGILDIDISQVNDGAHIWITFDRYTWTVLRYNEELSLRIVAVEKVDSDVRVTTNRSHNLSVNDIVGITKVLNLTGFYKIKSLTANTFTVTPTSTDNPEIEDSTHAVIGLLTEAKFDNYSNLDPQLLAMLQNGARLWINDNGSEQWEVIEKTKQYKSYELEDYGITAPLNLGSTVLYVEQRKHVITSIPTSNFVMVYSDRSGINGSLLLNQIIPPADGFDTAVNDVFGQVLAVSPDGLWLAVGTPMASAVPSKFRGELTSSSYLAGDVVLHRGKLWEAVNNIDSGDGSTINFTTEDWQPATLVEASAVGLGTGYVNQGMVSLYKFQNGQWENQINIVSPRPRTYELFGSDIKIAVSGSRYTMAVSAKGSLCDTQIGPSTGKGRVYLYEFDGVEWKHYENSNYLGIYGPYDPIVSPYTEYPAGSIVWSEGSLWQAIADNIYDGSSITLNSTDWIRLDQIATDNSLPTNVSLDDDGSTLALGLLNESQLAELVKDGDQFGHSLAMSRDGSILVVGIPNGDAQYFANYKGIWSPYQQYVSGDVVRYQDSYHILLDDNSLDGSSNTSLNERPDEGEPWSNVGDSSVTSTGKIFIYQKNSLGVYDLIQTIAASNLNDINDSTVADAEISSGDQFGYAVDIDASGTTIVVSSPLADIIKQNQGAVYVFKKTGAAEVQFRLSQKLQSFESYTNEYFGSSVSISAATERVVVGAKNSGYDLITTFDSGSTTFDSRRTSYSTRLGYPGQVYVFERKDQGYLLAEKLEADFVSFESFGHAVDCTSSVVVVGSPTYKVEDIEVGMIRLFKKDPSVNSLKIIRQQTAQVDLDAIKNIEIYDDKKNVKLADLDIVDHFKLKTLSLADQDIRYKTVYDPAIYMVGDDTVTIDESQAWFEDQVGEVWWDLDSVKFLNYEQDDLSYRVGNWNAQVEGSRVDVYEWVETPLLPSEWSILADTVEGLAEGISGQPKNADDTVYNVKILTNPSTGNPTNTLYYYWVKNKTTLPTNADRRMSVASISSYISNPIGTGIPFVAILDTDKFAFYNFKSVLNSDTAKINIEFNLAKTNINPVHKEYQLLTEGVADSLPADSLERKWLDSLVGFDDAGNTVPDFNLSENQRYGLSFRPRQTMFVNRAKALRIAIDNINSVLETRPFTDLINFVNLNSTDPLPSEELNEYDIAVDEYIDLEQVGTAKIKSAEFRANIINGRIDTIDIVDPGFGYRTVPFIEIEGTGTGAKAAVTLDSQGRVVSCTVLIKGKKYTSAIVKIRPFTVLVRNDSTDKNFWSLYGWDQLRKIFYRRKSQGFNTSLYWEYIDWWTENFDEKSKIFKEINYFYEEPSVNILTGSLLRVKEYGSGGWAVLQKTEKGQGSILENYNLVGRQNGTIRIKETLYDAVTASLGYDNIGPYDSVLYDLQPIKELRSILKAVKEDIFVDDLSVEWNKLFFSSVKYSYAEQQYIDWAFKTSFLNAIHNVGDLDQRPNYKNDNLDQFRSYIEEVKPYRTTVREYTSRYTEKNNYGSALTDFDLPAAWSVRDGKILPVSSSYNRFDEYPWKSWLENNGFSIIEIAVSKPGSGYKTPPKVLIEGNGTGASATAFISSGKVSGIRVDNPGIGYTKTPTILLVGGNGTSQDVAKASAILGNTKIRSFDLGIKFDRIAKQGLYNTFTTSQTFTATGYSAVFNLNYAPSIDKTKISIIKNNQLVLPNEYEINLYKTDEGGFTLLKGKIRFFIAPAAGDVIVVDYEKNDEILDSINRIEKYYSPTAGMIGKEINQLMTGIDYGGVQIQGTTFDVTGGWDALPWFTDNWDSVESNSDFYYVADGSTTFVVLPYVPENNQPISIYLKRVYENRPTRIDDPYFLEYDGSTPQPNGRVTVPDTALIPTFIGDGSTNIVEIHDYISTSPGDTLIFRKLESDGSVTITDVNLLDTRISGGSLSAIGGAYVTAAGLTPEEIVIDGDKFVTPENTPAPEENLPGQVLDSLSFKVFTITSPGASALQNKVLIGDGQTLVYDIGLTIFEASSVMVYVDKIKQEYVGDSSVSYSINFINNTIEFNNAPPAGSIIEIISIGIGGIQLLDYQEFVADGTTNLFLTKALYEQTFSILVTVDGQAVDVGFANSSDFIEARDKTLVQFGTAPGFRKVIKIICFGASAETDSTYTPFTRVNRQAISYDGSTRSYELDTFVILSQASAVSNILVEVNGRILNGVDNTYVVYDGTNNNIEVGVDPDEAIGTIVSGSIKVYINNVLQRFVIDYTYNGNQNLINVPSTRLQIGDVITVITDTRAEYFIDNNNIVFSPSLALTQTDEILVTWFSEYATMNLVSDEYTGGQINYKLARRPVDVNYLWVYKNGYRLTKDRDYYLDPVRSVVYFNDVTINADQIKIVQFGNIVYELPRAFEIYKDMFNNYHYKRYSKSNNILLAKDLSYFDTSMELTDTTGLSIPDQLRNIPGVIIINNERIEYFNIQGNIISQLRRGCLGTAIKESHAAGSYVINVGADDTLPYLESQEKTDLVSDGSSLIIGPLDFTPRNSNRSSWTRISIPDNYYPCDEIEVFVGGRRLRKDSVSLYDQTLGATSPTADFVEEAEFSVDGITPYVRLTEKVAAGTRISIIRKVGRVWYERGQVTASKGVSLLSNDTPIAKFIAAKSTELPE
jgi:Fe-S cluster assembly iron-binding protein IscA